MKRWQYVQVVSKKGAKYYYFRRGGKRWPLPDPDLNPEGFKNAYGAALNKSSKGKVDRASARKKSGTVAWWSAEYQASPEFDLLRPRTKEIYIGFLSHLEARHGDKPLAELTEARVWKIRDTEPGPVSRVNGMLKVLSLLCRLAVRRGQMRYNPVRPVPPRPTSGTGHKVWTEDLVEQYEECWAQGTIQRTLFDLAIYTAQRRSDIAKLRWDHIGPGGISLTQQKTGTELLIPLHPSLVDSLEKTPKTGPYIIGTNKGLQRSDKALGNYFRQACDKAGIPAGYPLHGLRKTAAVRLVEAGVSVDDACAITGHQDPKMLRHYAASAEQKTKAIRAMEQLVRNKNIVKSPLSVNPEENPQ